MNFPFRQHLLQLGQKLLRLREGENIVIDVVIHAGLIAQLRHIVGIRHKAHVEYKIRLDRNAVFKAKGNHVHAQTALLPLFGKQAVKLALELGGTQMRRVDHIVRTLTQRAQQLLLAPHGVLDGRAVL